MGHGLKPVVKGILNPKSTGAGIPDIGFYTATQIRGGKLTPGQATNPERGAVEAKGASQDLHKLAHSAQAAKYLAQYRLVLVTNLREFWLLEARESGELLFREKYGLGSTETAFWSGASLAHRADTDAQHGQRLTEFLRRVLLYKAPLTAPDELARFLASYAREALARLEQQANLEALAALKQAMEQALGTKFTGDKGRALLSVYSGADAVLWGVFSLGNLVPHRNGGSKLRLARCSLDVARTHD